ncbi:MAG: NADH-quinone oxidoreductase subunit N, partial [Vicinamibacterales bacterium]
YLRVIVMMYMAERQGTTAVPDPIGRAGMAALAIAIVVILYLGVLPTRVLDLATQSIATIF